MSSTKPRSGRRILAALALAALPACPRSIPPANPPTVDRGAAVAAALRRFQGPRSLPEPQIPATEAAGRLLAGQRYDEAAAALEPIARQYPGHGRTRLLLALSHHKAKRYAVAREHFDKLLDIGPTFERAEMAFYYYGWCLYYLGEPNPARAAFEAYLTFADDDYDAVFGLGLCALEGSDLDGASTHFQRSLDLLDALIAADPREAQKRVANVAKAHAGLGDVALSRGDLPRAREQFETCVRIYPRAYETWFKLFRLYTRIGEPTLAEAARQQHEHWQQVVARDRS